MDTDALSAATDGLRRAVSSQAEDADPDHGDFYTWGSALTELTDRLGTAARLLAAQVAAYGNDATTLRDDEALDPLGRLTDAGAQLHQLYEALGTANTAARAYHATIGHITTEYDQQD